MCLALTTVVGLGWNLYKMTPFEEPLKQTYPKYRCFQRNNKLKHT